MSKIKTALLGAVCLIAAAGAFASETDNKSDAKIFPYKYEMRDLKNGLRVIVVPTDYPNIVALQIPVSVGSRNEVESGKTGFAHFFEHMMFRGTPNYSAEEYNALIKNTGADQNAWTSDDMTNYHTTFSKDDLELVLKLEADRFQNLKFSVEDFKTEARAVLGEYNKNFANPFRRLFEAQRKVTYEKHTYRHTTMGFIEDIENMPNQFEYSLKFFDRYYRPEYVTIILVGDLDADKTFKLVEKHWGSWKGGDYKPEIPQEPAPSGPIYAHSKNDTPTLPLVSVAFRGPAFSDTKNDMAAMDIIQSYAFSPSSPLYQKLVVKEQKVDVFGPSFPDQTDPALLTVLARVKDPKDVWYVRDEILKGFAQLRVERVDEKRLADIKGNLKYGFANGMDNSEAIAEALVGYVARTRDPETINRVYRLYDSVTADDVIEKANKYFTDKGLVTVTLSHEDLPEIDDQAGSVEGFAKMDAQAAPEIATLLQKGSSPLINIRLLFNVGAASDPDGKEGLANLTAAVLTGGGSKEMKYTEIQKALFPIAAGGGYQVDKEMTVFTGTTHKDNLEKFHGIVLPQLLNPGWDEDDFKRVKTNMINAIKVSLRENNDEELGKEVLYEEIYKGHPYGHLNLGHIESVENLKLDDVKDFYAKNYTRANLTLGLAGDFSDGYVAKFKRDLGVLAEGEMKKMELPAPEAFDGLHATIVEKNTRATAISFGFPIDVNRSHKDFAALWLARSYLGEHRSSNSHLFQRIREVRGMNYGDYAYIEYFPSGMFQFHPDPNLGRQQQIFQIWIRPVTPENAHFAIRAGMFELNKLVTEGMSEEDFEATRNYLLKFVNILTKTQDRQLGYALDSKYYGVGEFTSFIRDELKKLTVADVNRVIKAHLQDKNIKFAIIAKDAAGLRDRLLNNTESPIKYDAPKPDDVLAEDVLIQNLKLDFKPENVKIVPVEKVFND